jgi:two-component system, OmpR family, phosphate regulon sensor histidine kinase PhoR
VNGGGSAELRLEAERGRVLIEESREIVVVLDEEQRVIGASRRARQSLAGLEEGRPLPEGLGGLHRVAVPLSVPYEVDGRRETLLYLSMPGDLVAYEELRAGFTAAVSHELRTPLARLLTLLESASLPGADPLELIEQARGEVEQIDELIGEVLFLSELETGREVVALGSTHVLPVVREVVERLAERAARAGVRVELDVDAKLELPLRRRMLRVVVENLLENAIRYAGDGASARVDARREDGAIVLRVADDGAGVAEEDLPRLFERFFRADRARASRGTGLGLAIVKHVVASAGGSVEARGGPRRGLEIRCTFQES